MQARRTGLEENGRQAEAGKQKRSIDADASAYEVKAEAGAIQARGEALRNNPSLPTMVPGNTVTFLNIAK